MIYTNNFSSILLIGDDILLRNFLININVCKHIIYIDGYEFNIYKHDGIDFINFKIDLDHCSEVLKVFRIIKNYINKKKYLLSNILYFISDCEEKYHKCRLSILSTFEININLVSLKPKTNFDNYIDICTGKNRKSFILQELNIDKEEFLKIIKNMYNDEYECIYDLFIKNM